MTIPQNPNMGNRSEPTEEEIMAMISQMREVPVSNVLIQALGLLITGAEAKLGRKDARPLIDVISAVVEQAGEHLGESASELSALVVQLKTSQVQAEKHLESQGEGSEGAGETTGGNAAQATANPTSQPPKKQTDKLWIPGRD